MPSEICRPQSAIIERSKRIVPGETRLDCITDRFHLPSQLRRVGWNSRRVKQTLDVLLLELRTEIERLSREVRNAHSFSGKIDNKTRRSLIAPDHPEAHFCNRTVERQNLTFECD